MPRQDDASFFVDSESLPVRLPAHCVWEEEFMKRSFPSLAVISSWASRALLLACLLALGGTTGCATETVVTKGPHFALSHPDFWKVKSVASKDGEATTVSIGRYSETVMNEGVGATSSAQYESTQADVEVRIFTWPGVDDGGNPSLKVANLVKPIPDLQLDKAGMVPADKECGASFARKYTVAGQSRDSLDLLNRPGFRTIIVGAATQGILTGVLARVPYEQDQGLYCHNLSNMRTQLGLLLEGLTITADGVAAPPGAGPAASAPPPAEAPK
jgi:hypothetical protein